MCTEPVMEDVLWCAYTWFSEEKELFYLNKIIQGLAWVLSDLS
jgi:hypothetical protein